MDLGYALNLGLIFWVGGRVMDMYRGFGIDLAHFQGNGGWFLPVPATLVVGRDGRVKARFVDPDFRHRMRTEDGSTQGRPSLRTDPLPGPAGPCCERPGQRPVHLKFSYLHPSLTL